jgi:hypothetical protein
MLYLYLFVRIYSKHLSTSSAYYFLRNNITSQMDLYENDKTDCNERRQSKGHS